MSLSNRYYNKIMINKITVLQVRVIYQHIVYYKYLEIFIIYNNVCHDSFMRAGELCQTGSQ